MTIHRQRFDRVLPGLFDELADARTPDYLEAAIEHASTRSQRPAWTFPGRWLPVQITTQAARPARVPWRQLSILALIGILTVAAAVAYFGSRRSPSPAPYFGPAANGRIVVERDGDIVTVDLATGAITPIVTGPELDSAPVHSRDGTRIAFQRRTLGAPNAIMVGAADGSGLVQATPDTLSDIEDWTLSPDGRSLVVTTRILNRPVMQVITVDGSHAPVPLAIELPTAQDLIETASYRPPDGRELLVIGMPEGAPSRGLYILDATSGALLRTLVEPAVGADVFSASWSPDGDAVSYGVFDPAGEGLRGRLHVVSADGTGSRVVNPAPDVAYQGALSEWSNDGTRVVAVRGSAGDGTDARWVIMPVARDGAPVPLDCAGSGPDTCPDAWIWSPDDTVLLGMSSAGGTTRYVLADPATGATTPIEWTGTGLPDWQRLAP